MQYHIQLSKEHAAKYAIVPGDPGRVEKIAAYLNQIENLGVDSFLENYKLQLQELKKEIYSDIICN